MLNKILDYCFITSKQPTLFKDLLVANIQHNEKMHVDATKLGFRLNIGNAYFVYIVAILIVLAPLLTISHSLLVNINVHISVILSVIFTATIFIVFNFYKSWLEDKMAQRVIKKAWKTHFPFFAYDEYKYKIEEIFYQAMSEEVSKKDLERYVMDKLTAE